MTRILPPRAVKPLRNLLLAIYGPEGCGKTLLALKTAHRLAAPTGADVVLVDADDGRAAQYSEFAFRPEPFRDVFSTRRLIEMIDDYTAMAREAPGSIIMVIDSLTPFWEGNGGLKQLNDTVHAQDFKGNTWSAWSVTGPQEVDPLYAAMRRFSQYGHMIVCLEQRPDYEGNKQIGVMPKFREGFGHRMDFVLRAERYFHQDTTANDAAPKDAASSSHRVVIEKVTLARSVPNSDGTVDNEYPVRTGTVVPDPDGGIGARLLEYLNEGAGDYEGVTKEYLESIKDADRDGLLKAYNYAKNVAWPEEHRQALMDAVVALGSKFQTAPAAVEASPVQAVEGPADRYFWSALTPNHPVEEWMQAAEGLDNQCDSDIELDAFLAAAKQAGRWDNVHELIENRKQELAHDRKEEAFRESQGLDANEIF
jgi:hypothetical protein